MIGKLAGTAAVAGIILLCCLLAGGTWIAPAALISALIHPHDPQYGVIVWQLRMPRVFAGALAGAALATAGALMQGLLRNPLVDPFLTGVSSGAALAIVAGAVFGVSFGLLPAGGFATGIVTAIIVASLARRGAGIDPTRLILAGVSLSALFSAIIALIVTGAQSATAAQSIVAWLAGSLAGRGWSDVTFALPYVGVGLLLAALAVPALNALRLGDIRAASVGLDVGRAQWLILTSASLLTASAVSLCGTVGFVGLIVPHVARRFAGSDARISIAASALIGAASLASADALCRTLAAPAEIPIGVLLAFVGVPAFLYIYVRDRRVATS